MTAVSDHVISHNKWQLTKSLTDLSQADSFEKALREWSIISVADLEVGEDSETCLCGHYPIREVFTVFNKTTQETANIGNVCIRFFYADQRFKGSHKIIDAIKRLKRCPIASANQELIQLACQRGVITSGNANFYQDIWRKTRLTPSQKSYKQNINRKILLGVIYTVGQAFQRIQKDIEISAGPKLIGHAYKLGVLTTGEFDFYQGIWDRSISALSPKQQSWKVALNQKIINAKAVLQLNSRDSKGGASSGQSQTAAM